MAMLLLALCSLHPPSLLLLRHAGYAIAGAVATWHPCFTWSACLCLSQGVGASGLSSCGLLGIPGGKLGSCVAAEPLELLFLNGSHRQLEANAVRVVEVDGIDEVVISDAQDLNACGLEPLFG